MIAADPVLVARNADPVGAALSVTSAAAPVDAGGGDQAFAVTLAQIMGAATDGAALQADASVVVPVAVPEVVPEVLPGAVPEATAMLADMGRIATLVPEAAVAAPMMPEVAVAEGVAPEAVVPEAMAAPLAVVDGAETAVAPAAAKAAAEVAQDAVAVATAPEGDDGDKAVAPEGEAEAAPLEATPVVLPVVELSKPEAAVVIVAPAVVPQSVMPTAKAKDGALEADAAVLAQGQPKQPRGGKPVKDSAPTEKPVEAGAKKDVEKETDDSTPPAQRARAVVPDGVAVVAPTVRAAEDLAKPEMRLDAAAGAVDAPAPAAGNLTSAATTPMQAATAQPPVMTDRPGWEGVIAERIAADLSEDGSLIEMELSPDNLGNLKITLDLSSGEAQVRFVTETPEAARLIQQNEYRLSDALARAGLSLGGHETTSRDPQGDRSGQGHGAGAGGGGFVFERAAEAAPGRAPGALSSGSVNLIA